MSYFSFLFGLFGSAWAEADGAHEAQAALSKAYNNFYKELRAKPNMTPAERTEAYRRIVAPARASVEHAIQAQTQETMSHARPLPSVVDRWGKAPHGKGPSKPADTRPAVGAQPTSEPAPEVGLDGKGVPREVEFTKQKKKKSVVTP